MRIIRIPVGPPSTLDIKLPFTVICGSYTLETPAKIAFPRSFR
jgi:hypothetical protein